VEGKVDPSQGTQAIFATRDTVIRQRYLKRRNNQAM
jgi:hypothetical protein